MNEELKVALQSQGPRMAAVVGQYETAKNALETFDANSRIKVKADGVKRTESEVDAMVQVVDGRPPLVEAMIAAKAALEGVKTDGMCLISHVGLICAETGAAGRIASAGQ